jgi:hypothetical protein
MRSVGRWIRSCRKSFGMCWPSCAEEGRRPAEAARLPAASQIGPRVLFLDAGRQHGRKCGEAEVVFLSRLENVMSFGFMRLRRFLNVGLSRLDFSSPFTCSSASKGARQGDRKQGGKELRPISGHRLRFTLRFSVGRLRFKHTSSAARNSKAQGLQVQTPKPGAHNSLFLF